MSAPIRIPLVACSVFALGCSAKANAPPSPVDAFANACKTFTSGARFAIEHHRESRGLHDSVGYWVLRINAQGKATLDGPSIRYSWNPNQPVMRDDWDQTPEDWTRIGGSALPARLTDIWNSCRSGFTDWTWGTPTQSYSTYTVNATMPYSWATGFTVQIDLNGTTAQSLSELEVYPPGATTTDWREASLRLQFTISEFNVQLAPNALNPDLPYGTKSPIPWAWMCGEFAQLSCFQRTGWAPVGAVGPLGN